MEEDARYDPRTCVTAGELRESGINIPCGIPHCAWVRRASMSLDAVDFQGHSDGSLSCEIAMKFTEAFQWVDVTFKIQKKEKVSGRS